MFNNLQGKDKRESYGSFLNIRSAGMWLNIWFKLWKIERLERRRDPHETTGLWDWNPARSRNPASPFPKWTPFLFSGCLESSFRTCTWISLSLSLLRPTSRPFCPFACTFFSRFLFSGFPRSEKKEEKNRKNVPLKGKTRQNLSSFLDMSNFENNEEYVRNKFRIL